MNVSRITNVLIFKDGYYWLTMLSDKSRLYPDTIQQYIIVPEDWGLDKNGFEYASDAYAYIAHLQWKNKEPEATLTRKIL